jgi:hypothetical protein
MIKRCDFALLLMRQFPMAASFYFALQLNLASKESVGATLDSVALPANEPAEWDEAGKVLALAGVHPYNPLTGIMLSRGISTGA